VPGPAAAVNLVATGLSFPLANAVGGAYDRDAGLLCFVLNGAGGIVRVDTTGAVADTIPTPAPFTFKSLAYDAQANRFSLGDATFERILVIDKTGAPLDTVVTTDGDQTGLAVKAAAGDWFWAAFQSPSIGWLDAAGGVIASIGSVTNVTSIEFLGYSQSLLVADDDGTRLVWMETGGGTLASWDAATLLGTSPARVRAMAFDPDHGHLYVANEPDGVVYRLLDADWTPTGTLARETWGAMKGLLTP